MAIVSLLQDGDVISLIYALWDSVREHEAAPDWPFSNAHIHWLYDEVDAAAKPAGKFVHRILLSDGRVLEIPLASVVMHRVSLNESTHASRQTA